MFIALLALFAASLVFRAPTLFVDYYDVDELAAIVQTHEYLAGDVPGRDFAESKLPLYHLIFKGAYRISRDYGWVIVHGVTILLVFFTSLFVFLTGRRVFGFGAGLAGGLLYAVLISSFNRQFMAVNGEIVYNLPLGAGIYFLVLFLEGKGTAKALAVAGMAAAGTAAAYVKFHGLIFFIFLGFFIVVYWPYSTGKFTRKYGIGLLGIGVFGILLFLFDLFFIKAAAPAILKNIEGKLFYASVKSLNPVIVLGKYIHRQGLLAVWHYAAWVPAAVYLFFFAKKKFKGDSVSESAVAMYFLIAYLMIFGGGSRLYFHYFMSAYPMLCIVAGGAISMIDVRAVAYIRRHFAVYLLLPGLFFLAWNTKDAVIRNFFPQGFYNEGKVLYWTRAVLMGTYNHYLLPEASYRDVCEYIARITAPSDRIFVWGDGPYLYYFSGRRLGLHHIWPKTGLLRILDLYGRGDPESVTDAGNREMQWVFWMEKKKPVLFIDTSENGLSNFNYPVTPLVREYVGRNYYYLTTVSKMKIYARKGFVPVRNE